MALTPYTERQATLIVNNVVRACSDITKLNGTGYKYINLCSGFIAHFNRYGFIDYYSRNSLREDILRNADMNQWRNFRPGDRDYEYYMAKADIYRRIVEAI
jgi:hypothetical protein